MSSVRPATLEQWLAHIEQQHPQAIAMGLERVREVAERMQLGRPAEHCIVVGGTNGKGSTVAFIESIARAAEWKVGAYTSPHLLRYNERVRIDGKDVDDASLVAGFNAVEDARGDTALTYFEYGTLCALWLFQQAGLDLAVLEVGLGGRLDAVNIIDGFNGLAAMVAMIMFASLGYVGFQVQDPVVLTTSMIMVGAILGFFIFNFPGGLIFLGDGGAYFLGFMLAEIAVLLVMRNPQVSPWYPALMVIYPAFEVCFSIYRKRFVRGISPGIPDGVHLHMLVYKPLMRWAAGARTASALTQRNSLTSPYLWLLCLLAVIPATVFWRHSLVLALCCIAFMVTYVWLYLRIVRFKAPRWLIYKK